MKVAHVLTEADIIHRATAKFKELAEQKSGGELEVQIYPTSALGSLRVTWESMQLGNLEGGNWDTVTPAMLVPLYAGTELPYVYTDLDHVHRVFDGPIGQELEKALMDKAKVRTIAVYDTTFRKIFTNTKPINSLADMKGLKIRVPEAHNYVRCMQLLGANPTPVAWGELYTALQMGVVEGFENKCEAAFNAKLHEQTKEIRSGRSLCQDFPQCRYQFGDAFSGPGGNSQYRSFLEGRILQYGSQIDFYQVEPL